MTKYIFIFLTVFSISSISKAAFRCTEVIGFNLPKPSAWGFHISIGALDTMESVKRKISAGDPGVRGLLNLVEHRMLRRGEHGAGDFLLLMAGLDMLNIRGLKILELIPPGLPHNGRVLELSIINYIEAHQPEEFRSGTMVLMRQVALAD